jgi:DEAD/DEAH box helicase domain-containing protein
LDQLEKVTSVADIYVNPNFDSELESKFIESLRRLGGKERLPFIRLVQDIVQGKSGYLLEVGAERYWVEPQVELGPMEGVAVMCKPDFVLWPAQSRSPRRPIAVFCDGWAYHQSITREDAQKRNALVASGRFWVWTVTWEDVQAAFGEKAGTDLVATLPPMYLQPLPPQLEEMADDMVFKLNSVAGLMRWLATPTPGTADTYADRLARHAGATAFRMMPHPKKPELETARAMLAQFWSSLAPLQCEKPSKVLGCCGNVNDAGVFLRYWWPSELIQPSSKIPPSPGFVVLDESVFSNETDRHLAWRRWLWLFNVFQALPGFLLATRKSLDAGDHRGSAITCGIQPSAGGGAVAHAAGWEAVMTQTIQTLIPGLQQLRDAGIPAPDEVGYEFANGDDVIAEAELAWTQRKVVLLMEHHLDSRPVWESHGWTALVANDTWTEVLRNHFNPSP